MDRTQLEQAIAAQESLRGVVDNAVVDAAVAALKRQLEQLDSTAGPTPQRKLATVMFMDMAGHTHLIRALDPEEIMELVDGALERLAAPVVQHGGHIVRYQGDGFKAVFGLPAADERDPDHAIRAALEMLELAATIGEEWQARGLPGFNIRVGVDSGTVLAGGGTEGQDAVTGLPVNLAARLESAAVPGTVLISHRTYQHVRGVFDLEPLPPVSVKGFDEPVSVYRVLRLKTRSFRTRRRGVEGVETHMIGRDGELDLLKQAYEVAVTQSLSRVVTIVGDAGLGKSRLLYEFENWADLQPANVQLYRARAQPETQRLPYGLLRDIFAFRYAIHDDDSPAMVRQKLEAGLHELFGTSDRQAHLIGHLLGYDFRQSVHVRPLLENAQRLRAQALDYLVDYFRARTETAPLLLLLEDLHWADNSSLDALEVLLPAMRRQPFLVVAAARPLLLQRRPDWLAGEPEQRTINLSLLSVSGSRQLARELLQQVPDAPDALVDLLVSRAEGNPFYLEELVRMLIEDGVIVITGPDWQIMPEKLAGAVVPPTLVGVLQARLDGLPPLEKDLLQRASVIGRLFWDTAVQFLQTADTVEAGPPAPPDAWRDLRARDLIFSREESAFEGAREFAFSHTLLREVTYEGVLRRARGRYHHLAAEWLILASGERAGEFAELIAQHFQLAGDSGREAEWQERAGRQAAMRYAHHEALPAFSRALELTPQDATGKRFDLLGEREAIYHLLGQRDRQLADMDEMQALAKSLGDPRRLAEAALRRSAYLHVTGDYAAALESGFRAAEWSAESGLPELQAAVHLRLGSLFMHTGQYGQAELHMRQALDLCAQTSSPRTQLEALRLLGVIAEEQGNFTEQFQLYEQALRLAVENEDRWGERRALNSLGVVTYSLGDYSNAGRYYEQSLQLARELEDRVGEVTVLGNMGTLWGTIGDYEQAERLYQEALAVAEVIGDEVGRTTTLLNIGAVLTSRGRPAEGLTVYEEALRLVESVGDRPIEGYVLTGLGHALLELGRPAEAADRFRQAIDLRESLGQVHLAVESRAGLAAARLSEGDVAAALSEIDRVMAHLESDTLEKTEEYLRVLLICYQGLTAAGDARAVAILERAHRELQETAAPLDDPYRELYLTRVPWNRAVVEVWRAAQG